ncbi:MATE family efflux transporter [uncultured Ilyobacter sp.]|uniref:MATE family efflux transporter n=1 Tax=uncultured Ilyobacter sp. TaxID=544433 RepID=UPI0029BFE609|nr:MATE family efflux transporter [uncultured Ilyobacter sp.]
MKNKLETGDIKKLLVEFAIPSIIGSTIVMLYTIIDRIFIGQRLGAEALAGVTLTFPFAQLSVAASILIGMGSSVLISIKLGAQKNDEAEEILGTQFLMFLLMCTSIVIIEEVFLIKFLNISGATKDTLEYAVSYARVFIPVIYFQSFTYGLNGVVRAQGLPKLAMKVSAIGAVTNVILDYIFLYILNMGTFGAGLATLLATAFASCFNLNFFIYGKSKIKLLLKNIKIRKDYMLDMLKLGASPSLIQLSNSLVTGIYNNQLKNFGGSPAIAAFGIMTTILSLVIMINIGLSQGMQPIVGFNLGAKIYSRVIKTFKLTFYAGFIISTVLLFIVGVFPGAIVRIFVDDPETIEAGKMALRLGLSVIPLTTGSIIISNFYQAIGDAKRSIIFSILRKIIIIIPALIFLPKLLGINGIWLSRPFSDTASFLIMGIFVMKTLKNMNDFSIIRNSQK